MYACLSFTKLFSSARGISQKNGDQKDKFKANRIKSIIKKTRRVRYLLVVQHAVRFGRHAIDAPLGVPVLIAYRDGEPAIVRPYQMDQLALAALDLQRLALASVCGVVPLCNRKCDSLFSFRPKLVIRSNSYNFTRLCNSQ